MAKEHSPKFLRLVSDAKTRIDEIRPEDLRELMATDEDLHLIDVREDHEYAQSHVTNAEHLSKGVIERDVEDRFPDPYTSLALYCGGGFRSALAADQLQKMGYERVFSVSGGFRALRDAGFDLTDETRGGRASE